MRNYFAVLAIALALSGCAVTKALFGDAEPITKDVPQVCKTVDLQTKAVTVNTACADAYEALGQANVVLSSIDRMALERLKAGVWTKAQAQPYYDQTDKLGKQLDAAYALFRDQANYVGARAEADAIKKLLLILEKQISARAAKSAWAPGGLDYLFI